MASDLNTVNIIGRLTKDAELKYTNSGFPITTMSLAVKRSVKKGDKWEEEASFFDVKLLGKRGESLQQYLVKGTQLGLNAELVQERWEQDGQKRSKVVLQVNNLQLLGGNKQEFNSQQGYGNNQQPNNQPKQSYNNTGFDEQEIPF